MDFIPVNEPLLDGREAEYLAQCIATGWISSEGPFVSRFEQGFAARSGRTHGIAVANGTAALDVAVQALGIGPGHEVVVPSMSIISCAGAVARAGAMPVPVDCDPATWNMDPGAVAAAVTERTRAVMAVHTYGLPCDMAAITALCRERGLLLIEDAAEMIGQDCDGRPCGSFGDLSVVSFYANKHVTTGEGGMVLADDPALAERCRSLRNLCFGAGARRFEHSELGFNYRMTNLQAAVGVAQLERLDEFVGRKRAMGRLYDQLLAGTPGLRLPVARTAWAENIYWVYGLVLEPEVPMDAAGVMSALAERGVGARPFFWPVHEQPVFRERGWYEGLSLPVSEMLARRGFYLPSGLALTDGQIRRSAQALREVLA